MKHLSTEVKEYC